ncbi:hypothetical protein AHiyo8_54470 [Arthrobacter sp. Hiyo8]|nr:hypothetical protein AHiyo8_54470 [Arthrobacter sp. Hiyo8]
MALLDPVPIAFRVHGKNDVRADLADEFHHLLDDPMRRFQVTIALMEVVHVRHADEGSGLSLLLCAHGDDLFAVCRIKTSGIAVCHDAIADLDAGSGPGSDGSGRAKVDVVRVGGKTKHPLNALCGGVERALC